MSHKCLNRRRLIWFFPLLVFLLIISGCEGIKEKMQHMQSNGEAQTAPQEEQENSITLTSEIVELEDGFSAVRYDGDYGFDDFLASGGASSDGEVVEYLANNLLSGLNLGDLLGGIFGCSTIAVQSPEGDALLGRNFDWENCEAMVVESHPENGYASLSTVNMDFITQNVGGGMVGMALNLDEVKTLAALYAPLDGMNEAGLAVSVNMIQDSAATWQDREKPDITTTTAVRLLLDKAGDVEEALELLRQYDLHGSMGMMIHFAIADSTGRSVAVEYAQIGEDTPQIWCTHYFLEAPELQPVIMQALQNTYGGDVYLHENSWPGLAGILSAMQALMIFLYAMVILFVLVVTLLTAGKLLRAEQKDLSIYRTLGFSAGQLRRSFALRFGVVALLGSILGTIFSAFLTDPLVAVLMRMEGISNFSSQPGSFTVLLPGIVVIMLFLLFAYFAAGRIGKASPALLAEE